MTLKDKKLLITDLCARLPYGVKYMKYSWGYDIDQEIPEVEVLECVDKNGYINHTKVYKINDIKPYLFPMSSMSEEQDEELKNIYYSYNNGMFYYTERIFDRIPFSKMKYFPYQIEEFFNKNHIDYRGLIEKGLAIDATNKNIY